ncbi:MAG: site-2 protease family protein [Acidobacteriota bacterium]
MGGFDIGRALVQFLVFMFAITVHESSHAATANYFGDPTAKRLGRISLNPIRHIDLFGTVIFPVMLALFGWPVFGWAKPVPVNVHNLRSPKAHSMLVSAAGPASNLALALAAAIAFQGVMAVGASIPGPLYQPILYLIVMGALVNVYLALFNMIPIHPLDGSGVLAGLLPDHLAAKYMQLQTYGFLILFVIVYTGLIDRIMSPVALAILSLMGFTFR